MANNPFKTLGLPDDADEKLVRAKYLELVKLHPPERDPEKFREIQAAFELARDPLALAKIMLKVPDHEEPPAWQDAINEQSKHRPRMQVDVLLSLGNQSESRLNKQRTNGLDEPSEAMNVNGSGAVNE